MRDGGGFLKGHIGRFNCQRPFFRPTYVLSISTQTAAVNSKNLVTFFK